MKILICYYFRDEPIPLGREMATAFTRMGHSVTCFDSSAIESSMTTKRLLKSIAKPLGLKERLSAHFQRRQDESLSDKFLAVCRKSVPEFILVIRGERIQPCALRTAVAESGAKTAVWWVKNPRWQSTFADEASHYDQAFSIDESLCGAGIEYLPSWAANREVFSPLPFAEKKQTLLFIGTWSTRRQRYLESIADLPLTIIGPDWLSRLPKSSELCKKVIAKRVSQEVMAAHYRSAWAVIDIHQIDQRQEQGVNMRFADVPASGTVLLTEPAREVERWRLEGRGAILFTSEQRLREVASGLLSDPDLCQTLSRDGLRASAEMPTFFDRAQQILNATRQYSLQSCPALASY